MLSLIGEAVISNCVLIPDSDSMSTAMYRQRELGNYPNRERINVVFPRQYFDRSYEGKTHSYISGGGNRTETINITMDSIQNTNPIKGLLSETTKMFQAEESVLAVKASQSKDKKLIVFNVLIRMPEYSRAIMEKLIDIEMMTDRIAVGNGINIEYNYIPDQVASIVCKDA